ncbi:TetR/AcrR family transcriptional regulator [Streptomyces sp. NRRL F-5123]|uniref:TetR/AcrR family transcriptional regulator n=1 Tax=Streptomyces sp. NRRL F-5123 TaxID=1463856 RepID=UPI00099B7FA5|nr:TetR/AcrR family transcriptional regulator [Streptomyces sp. NRRL F-5123]
MATPTRAQPPVAPSGALTPSPAAVVSRRRGEALRHAIFDAVFEQLEAVGYANLTMERIAGAAHTSKAVLYRRWTSKEELVADALKAMLPQPDEVALTGDLRSDLLALMRCVQVSFTATRGTAFQIVSAEAGCENGNVRRAAIERVVEPCTRRILDVLRRGAERGEVGPQAATELVAGVGPALLVQYPLVHSAPAPDAYLVSVVDRVLLPLTAP